MGVTGVISVALDLLRVKLGPLAVTSVCLDFLLRAPGALQIAANVAQGVIVLETVAHRVACAKKGAIQL